MNDNKKITSPIKAIRAKCIDCCAGSTYEVRLCPMDDCPLYEFRFGKNPYHKVNLTEEQKRASSERLKAYRASKKKEQGQ